MTDFQRFAEPIAGDLPCGPDCEYDSDFLALSQAVVGKPEQQFGDTVIPAVEPDWRVVDSLAQAMLERTKDLRVVAWLALANTQLRGVIAFAGGLKLMLTMCELYWDAVHPRIEVDGDTDPYLRMNAISAFSGTEFSGEDRLIQALRATTLVKSPVVLTYREAELAFSNATGSAYSRAQVEQILTDAIAADNTEALLVIDAWQSYQTLRTLLDEKVSAEDAPDMDRLGDVLKAVAVGIERMQSGKSSGAADDTDIDGAESTTGAASAEPGISGQVRTREDARRALDRVCEYLERHEPSSPASLFARRAQRMLNMPFLEIMRELSPDSMAHLEMLTGAQAKEQDS